MKLRSIFLQSFLLVFLFFAFLPAQPLERPKLVVGIVVDQMRFDYLYKFYTLYSEEGFKKLMNNGSNFTYSHCNYTPTSTAPGHASIFTGTTPFHHGIIGNDWYDRNLKKNVNCTEDTTVNGVGTDKKEGLMSPKSLLSTTITDELKIFSGGLSKVFGVSIKDRGAILPAGHSADGAFWFDGNTGKFITSSYYMKTLPGWAEKFNSQLFADSYLANDWNLSKPYSSYNFCYSDTLAPKFDHFSEGKTSFPHSFKNVPSKKKYEAFKLTPGANTIVAEFAKEIIINEKLGKGDFTDFLTVSFSATDYVGHLYGPNSLEVADLYCKLDIDIAKFIEVLDKEIGKDNYVLFLTADHAVAPVPELTEKMGIPSGRFVYTAFSDSVKAFSIRAFTKNLVESTSNTQIYLDYSKLSTLNLDLNETANKFAKYILSNFPQIKFVTTRADLERNTPLRDPQSMIGNGFNSARSGDVFMEFTPNVLYYSKGSKTSHSTSYSYDTHVPLIFYGWGIPKQEVNDPVFGVDIAATISDLLKIQETNACMGKPLIKKK